MMFIMVRNQKLIKMVEMGTGEIMIIVFICICFFIWKIINKIIDK